MLNLPLILKALGTLSLERGLSAWARSWARMHSCAIYFFVLGWMSHV